MFCSCWDFLDFTLQLTRSCCNFSTYIDHNDVHLRWIFILFSTFPKFIASAQIPRNDTTEQYSDGTWHAPLLRMPLSLLMREEVASPNLLFLKLFSYLNSLTNNLSVMLDARIPLLVLLVTGWSNTIWPGQGIHVCQMAWRTMAPLRYGAKFYLLGRKGSHFEP